MPGTSGKYLESVSSGWVNAGVAGLGTADAPGARNTVIASTATVASSAGAVTARRRSGRMCFSFGAGHGRRPVERAVETQVDRGDDEEAQQGGGDEAAEDDDGERVLDLVARAGAEDDERPAPERRLEQQEDEEPGHDGRGEQPALGGLALLVLPEDLCVVAAGEADPRELGVELGDDRAEVPALDAGTDVETA